MALVATLAAARGACAGEPPFSSTAAKTSDTALAVTVITPVALQVAGGFDEDLLLYGEAVGISLALNTGVKFLVARPRPYTHSADPRIQRFAASQRADARLSFYSAHASVAFTSAVAGSLLFDGHDQGTRSAVWGFEMALAGATANLRVRAGKHYRSDVIVGALVGTAIGVAVPALQGDGVTAPSAAEWGAIAAGLLVGVAGSEMIPCKRDILEPLDAVTPVSYPGGGAGLSISGAW